MLTKYLALFFLVCFFPISAQSHSGRTDSSGGHNNRKTGEYHYHNSGKSVVFRSTPSNSEHTYQSVYTTAEIEKRIYSYFRDANEGVGALDCSVAKTERDVSQETKNFVKRRDGQKCVICGNLSKLEVDHIRALMNGGSNIATNLATLCDDCHTIKTRLDSSLRRKRNRICR